MILQETTYNILNIAAPYGKEALLNAVDPAKRALLDLLIDNEFKDSVSHPSIQSYVSELWTGLLNIFFSFHVLISFNDVKYWLSTLNRIPVNFQVIRIKLDCFHLKHIQNDRYFLIPGDIDLQGMRGNIIAVLLFIFPPLWFFMCLPVHKWSKIPTLKFFCHIVSHLYFILCLCIVIVIPWDRSGREVSLFISFIDIHMIFSLINQLKTMLLSILIVSHFRDHQLIKNETTKRNKRIFC